MTRILLWLVVLSVQVFAADRYWIGAAAGCDGTWADTDCWAATSGGAGPVSVPGSADDVFFDGVGNGAANSTLGASITINSLNMTGYVNTLTHNASVTLTHDSSGVFTFSAGMTYTRGSLTSSAISFTSTSGTTLITTAGKTMGNITFNGAGGTFSIQDSLTLSSGGLLTITAGTFTTNNNSVTAASFLFNGSSTKTLTLGSSAISVTGSGTDIQCNATGTTISANTATLTVATTGHSSSLGSCNWNGASFVYTAAAASISSSGATIGNLTRTGTAAKTNTFTFSGNLTITGTFLVNGNSVTNRMLVTSDTLGTARTITAATVSASSTNVDFRDITGAGAGSWNISGITGYSGDCGGNTNITFSTPETQTSTGTSSFSWSTHGWTTRVPLCQDPVVVNNAFSSGQTVTVDMPRIGQDIDFSGMSWSGTATTIALTHSGGMTVFGSMTMKSGVTLTHSQNLTFEGRGSHTITSAGRTWNSGGFSVEIKSFGGTYTLADAFAGAQLILTNGTLNTNNQNVTLSTSFVNTSTSTRTLTLGSSLVTLTASSATTVWNAVSTGLTVTANTATIEITNTGVSAKTFAGAGITTYHIIKATGNNIVVTGNNTFNTIHLNCPACTIGFRLPAGGTTTFTNLISGGSVGNLVVMNSSTVSSNTTLSKASGCVGQDYVDYADITGSGGATFNVGANSTLIRTSGLTAAACPSGLRRPIWIIR